MANYKGTPAIKQVNRKKSEGKTSRFFGVHWDKRKKKWRAMMRQWVNGEKKYVHLGHCREEVDAATLYVLRASIYYGQPIRVNDSSLATNHKQ